VRHHAKRAIVGLVTLTIPITWWGDGAPLAGASAGAFAPTFATVPCPGDVNPEDGNTLTCGFLTVLEDRADPAEDTIRLFVTLATPIDGNPPPDPFFSPGRDLGWIRIERLLGSRGGRVGIGIDQRGTGYSEPSLDCPEVRALTNASSGVPLGTREMDEALLDAVRACRDRLTSHGVDLNAYNLAAMAADAEDLRVALGIDDWNLMTWGTASAISFEIMRRYPDHVRAAAFDSPLPPHVDRFTGAILGTEYAVDQIVRACADQRSCHAAYPHLHRVWNQALTRLDEEPSTIRDEDLEIVVDDATAVRYLRNNLAQGINETTDIAAFPLSVYDLRRNGWLNGGPAGDEVGWAAAPPSLVGYDVEWGDAAALAFDDWRTPRLSHGAFYSYLCHDEVPFADRDILLEAALDRPWYVDAYVNHPYAEICERWGVEPAETDPHTIPRSDIPVLMIAGRFDPYSPLPLIREAAGRFSNGWVVRVPTRSRNAVATDCTIGIRDAFIVEPTSPPDTRCIADLEVSEPIRFALPSQPTREPGEDEAVISTVAGDGAFGSSGDGEPAIDAQVAAPYGLAADPDGKLFVVEWYGWRVRLVDAEGRISTAVGAPTGVAEPAPGAASAVELLWPIAVEVDDEGNLFVGAGEGTHRTILRVDPSGLVTRIVGTGEKGFSGDGGPATEATTTGIRDIAVDADGTIYFADYQNNRVRMVDPSGVVTTVVGTGNRGSAGVGGLAIEAELNHPAGVAVDTHGNLYVADRNHRVLRIGRRGIITVVAGTGEDGSSGDRGPATEARLQPGGIAVDAAGNLYVSDGGCGCVRMVDVDGIITTVAGTGRPGRFAATGAVAATSVSLGDPAGLAIGPDGSLYIADLSGDLVLRVVFP
jgi:pimeloyl-ACP methyl ester carboxylesterase/sugar lactone lactonase YvrE